MSKESPTMVSFLPMLLPIDVLQMPRFEDRLGHFFHKQRDAIGLLDNLLEHFRWQTLAARYVFNYPCNLLPR